MSAAVVEIRRHPRGGWTHARATGRGSARIYAGWWPSKGAAAQALVGNRDFCRGVQRPEESTENRFPVGAASDNRCARADVLEGAQW